MKLSRKFTLSLCAFALLLFTMSCSESGNEKQIEEDDSLEMYQKDLATNKKIVKKFITTMGESDVDQLKTMITEDFSWWIIGKPEYLSTAGEHNTEYFLGFFKGAELFPEGTDFRTTSMVAEGNSVAVEAEFKARTAMGTDYENYYHFLFILEDGKVKRMKEYMDTYHAKTTFGL